MGRKKEGLIYIQILDFFPLPSSLFLRGDMTPTLKEIVVDTEGCSTFNLTAEMVTHLGLPKTAIHPQNIAHHMGLYTMAQRGAFLASAVTV